MGGSLSCSRDITERVGRLVALGLSLWLVWSGVGHAKPTSVRATFSAATGVLTVQTKTADADVVLFDDVMDQELSRAPDSQGTKKTFSLTGLPVVPCRIRVESGGRAAVKAVQGVLCRGRAAPMVCRIVSPNSNQSIPFGAKLSFSAKVRGARSRHMSYEWDFGGGADARPKTESTGPITFNAQDDTSYWVTFTASDLTGAVCADRLQVTVGTPAEAPGKVAEQLKPGAPAAAGGEHVVLPFQPYGMAFHDLSYGFYSMLAPTNWIDAAILKKGGVGGDKPVLLGPDEVDVLYSAASSPWDPVGSDSINSTSQNYPLGAVYGAAAIKKSDWFDPCKVWRNPSASNASDTQFNDFFDVYLLQSSPSVGRMTETRPGDTGDLTNAECVYSNFFYPNWDGDLAPFDPNDSTSYAFVNLAPDQGAAFWSYDLISRFDAAKPGDEDFPGFRGRIDPNGSPMPGHENPYLANTPQAFPTGTMPETGDNYPGFDPERLFFAAKGLPQFPTDDKGRHNAYPLIRIQARNKSGTLLATTDGVTAVTVEMKCAECHTKGKNGADQSVYDALRADMAKFADTNPANDIPALEKYKGREKWIPVFVAPEDIDAARKSERDVVEQASMINIARLHDFYYNFIDESGWLGPLEFESEQLYGKAGEVRAQPGNCTDYCHKSVPRADPRRYNMAPHFDAAEGAGGACPEMSDSLHNIHGRLLGHLNADYTGTIERDPINRELKLVDLSKIDPANPPEFLLAVKDAGTPDDSCFFCHAGRQDKYQRDVMSTAGVNCIDCHGDLAVLAGGGAMVSRAHGSNPLDSRGGPGDLTATIDTDKLAEAYMAERSSYAREADGTWHFLEKGADGLYRRNGTVVSTLDMVLNFLGGTGVANADGTYTLTKQVDGQPDQVTTVTEAELLEKVKTDVNGWNLHFARIPWAEELSCASCHTGVGDEPVRRRAYDMTTGQFRLLTVVNERFAENLLPKKHDSSFTLLVQDGQSCPPGTFSDTVADEGQHVCQRGLFKDSLDRHGKLPCASCHGAAHAIWPNSNPYHNDNVTALQLQGHTGTLLECESCHEKNGNKDVFFPTGSSRDDIFAYLIKGPHDMHPVADPRFILNDRADGTPAHQISHGDLAKFYNAEKAAGRKDLCADCHGESHTGSRLAKTPVDRTLAVSNLDRTDLAQGTKKQIVVKKNQEIGCDLCHSLEKSFTQ